MTDRPDRDELLDKIDALERERLQARNAALRAGFHGGSLDAIIDTLHGDAKRLDAIQRESVSVSRYAGGWCYRIERGPYSPWSPIFDTHRDAIDAAIRALTVSSEGTVPAFEQVATFEHDAAPKDAERETIERCAKVCDEVERLGEQQARTLPNATDRLRADDRRFLAQELAAAIRALSSEAPPAREANAIQLLQSLVAAERKMQQTYRAIKARGDLCPSWPRDVFEAEVDHVIERTQELFPSASSEGEKT